MALSVERPSVPWPPVHVLHAEIGMGWEELTRLSDRELLLLLHQRVEALEGTVEKNWQAVEKRWGATWKVAAWIFSAVTVVFGLFIAAHAAKIW